MSDSRIHEFNQRSFIPLCVSTLRLIFLSWKCDVYQFPFHLLLCFHFLILNNFSKFLLVSIPIMIDQSNESNPVDSHHLEFRASLSRFGIGGETPVTSNLSSGTSVDQIQYMAICERSIMLYCSHGLLWSSFGMGMASF